MKDDGVLDFGIQQFVKWDARKKERVLGGLFGESAVLEIQ
jgi:hypothetical protein